jgi:hypothetical protein
MAISTSTKTVEDMKVTLQSTVREINAIQAELRSTMQSADNWKDVQGQEYRQLMKKVANLTEAPKQTLIGAVPKLDRMIQALKEYERIRF